MKAFLQRYCRNYGAVIGLLVLLAVLALAMLAPVFYEESPWLMVAEPLVKPFTTRPCRSARTCWAATSPPACFTARASRCWSA